MINNENLEEQVETLIKYGITPAQYLLMAMVYYKRTDLMVKVKQIQDMEHVIDPKVGHPYLISFIRESEVRNLESRGWLINLNKDGEHYPEFFSLHDDIEQELFEPTKSFGEEFWSAYPNTLTIDGKVIGAKSCDKEWFLYAYASVCSNRKVHGNMMKLLDKFKRLVKVHKLNAVGIEKYMKSRMWETVADIDESSSGDTTDYSITI